MPRIASEVVVAPIVASSLNKALLLLLLAEEGSFAVVEGDDKANDHHNDTDEGRHNDGENLRGWGLRDIGRRRYRGHVDVSGSD